MNSEGRIVMLANAGHKPLDTRIFHKEALSLAGAGFRVTLIIPHSESIEKNGIQVKAVPLPRRGWEQLVLCPWRIFRLALKEPRSSVFQLHDSELLLAGIALRWSGRKVIYDAHEDTPLQISYQHWVPSLIKPLYILLYRLLEKIAGWCFRYIIVAEPVIAKYFPSSKVVLIRNFPRTDSFQREVNYATREQSLMYVGLLSKPRGVVEMLEGHRLASENVKVKLVLGGKFAPATLERDLLSRYHVDYRAWLPYEEMINALYMASIGIIVPHPIERYKTNYPVKLFEYMAAGLPVIASKEGESATFVREAEAGILVDPLKPEQIAEAIIQLASDPAKAEAMGKRGRNLIFQKYNWESEAAKLIQLHQQLRDE
jgi:glycosyltransferase involved in cell wall biosynthesis